MIYKLIKNIKRLFFPVLLITISSCSNINSGINQAALAGKKVNINKGSDISLTIKPVLPFTSKATSSSSGALPKSLADVKSFSAFLTNDFADPFKPGANPFGDGEKVSVNYSSGEINVLFHNVPEGGPYVAVVAAFDSDTESIVRNNLTRPDPDIPTSDKQWARSINGVLVKAGGIMEFTDHTTALNATLTLLEPVPSQIGSTINVGNGSSNTTGAIKVN
jgi:hypothetical protein